MDHSQGSALEQFPEQYREQYPHGRGYGHDYMRGGEVLGGYGYAEREEYAKRRGEVDGGEPDGSLSPPYGGGPDHPLPS